MPHVAIIGAGITGVTTAYSLLERGFDVTLFDRHRYAAMDTSFANGGQLSASNAEVWNSIPTLLKGIRWMGRRDAPLLVNPKPSWHKYSWFAEFVAAVPHYGRNTRETARLALLARARLFEIAEVEGIDFDLEKRGILHFYTNERSFAHALRVNALLNEAGVARYAATPSEMRRIEPTLCGDLHGGFHTPDDATGDIHKFTRGLARVCAARGARFVHDAEVGRIEREADGLVVGWTEGGRHERGDLRERFDAVTVCAGVGSRAVARGLGDRVNVYPVKGYSITVEIDDGPSRSAAPWTSLLDDDAKVVTSRLGADRFRVAGTAEFNGHDRDIRAARIRPLIDWVRRHFPDMDTTRCVPWAGLRPMMPDMLPRVGPGRHPRVFYNTGHGHLGWTLSAATAEIVADAILSSVEPARSAATGPRTPRPAARASIASVPNFANGDR